MTVRQRGSVVSSESRWRRGCTTDGSELVVNSEARGGEGGPGCRQAGQYDTGGQVGEFTSDIESVFHHLDRIPPIFCTPYCADNPPHSVCV